MDKHDLSNILDSIAYTIDQITFPCNYTETFERLNFEGWIFCYCNYKLLEDPNVVWDAEIWNDNYFCDKYCYMKYYMSGKK